MFTWERVVLWALIKLVGFKISVSRCVRSKAYLKGVFGGRNIVYTSIIKCLKITIKINDILIDVIIRVYTCEIYLAFKNHSLKIKCKTKPHIFTWLKTHNFF